MKLSDSARWWWATAAIALVRLVLAAWAPLGDDEGYYWVWSRHPAFGYYEHPPLVAWLVGASTGLFGVSLLALRLPFVLLGVGVALQARSLVREATGDERLARRASLVLQIVPVLFALGLMVIPDSPLLFFWLLCGRALLRVERHGGNGTWALLGMALGGALVGKYVAALLALACAGYLIETRQGRPARPPILALLVAAALFAPVVWWNAGHGWASFRYEFLTRHHPAGVDFARLGLFVASQLAYASPGLLAPVAMAALRLGRWRPAHAAPGERLLWWLGAPTLAVFLLAAAVTDFKPNWPAPAYLTLVPLALLGLDRLRRHRPTLGAWIWGAALAGAAVFTALPAIHLVRPVLPLPAGADPTVDMRGWPTIAAEARRAAADMQSAAPPAFAAGRYQLAARLEFYLPGHPAVISLNPGRDAYDDWQDLSRLAGRNLVFLASDRFPASPGRLAAFDSTRVFRSWATTTPPQPAFAVTIYQCWGYRP